MLHRPSYQIRRQLQGQKLATPRLENNIGHFGYEGLRADCYLYSGNGTARLLHRFAASSPHTNRRKTKQ